MGLDIFDFINDDFIVILEKHIEIFRLIFSLM